MTRVAIIPARGGSKRIPKKNIRSFLGKPIIAYAIENALSTNLFDEVIVSTDNDEIAGIAKSYGAKIPFLRSEKNATDFATTNDVISEVLEYYETLKIEIDEVLCLYPCTPLLKKKHLIEALDVFNTGDFDSIISVVKYSTPIERALKISNNYIQLVNEETLFLRSQDFESRYYDAGQFYLFKVNSFKKQARILTNNSTALILDEMEVQDIDNENDWLMAELKYKLLINEK
jgi:pseudaminic acid cytidylyltransferase